MFGYFCKGKNNMTDTEILDFLEKNTDIRIHFNPYANVWIAEVLMFIEDEYSEVSVSGNSFREVVDKISHEVSK